MTAINKDREYNLTCTVKVIRQTFKDYEDRGGRQQETDSVVMIIDKDATESWAFLSAWFPKELSIEHYVPIEVPSYFPYPVEGYCRLAIMPPDNKIQGFYLFVMSTGVEDILKKCDGRRMGIKILTASDDELCDSAPTLCREAAIE